MGQSVVFSVRVDKDVKSTATDVFNELGLSLNAGIDIYLRAVVRRKAIPFPLDLDASSNFDYRAVTLKGGNEVASND